MRKHLLVLAAFVLIGLVTSSAYAVRVESLEYLERGTNQYIYQFVICTDKNETIHNPSFKFQSDMGTTGPFEYKVNLNSNQCKILEATIKAKDPESIKAIYADIAGTDELSKLKAENEALKKKIQDLNTIIQEQIKVIMDLIAKSKFST